MEEQLDALGRKVRPWGNDLRITVGFRCHPDLRDRITRAARSNGLTPSEWMRVVLEAVLDEDAE